MKTAKAGTIIKYRGKICEVIGFATDKVLFIREVNAKPCPHCHETKEYTEVECSRNFQERAEPVETLEVN